MAVRAHRLAALAPVAALGVVLAASAAAQQRPPAPPATQAPPPAPTEQGKRFGDWIVRCEAQKEGGSNCFLSQSQVTSDTGKRVVNVNLGYFGPKGEPMLVAFLPLGIHLEAGAAVNIEPGVQVRLTLEACTGAGCRASATLDARSVGALPAAEKIVIWIFPFGNREWVSLPVSTNGLAAGLASLKK